MKSKAKAATVAEKARMARLKEMPCVACRAFHYVYPFIEISEVHHLLSGNKRRGHLFTIPLCAWHHRGDCGSYYSTREAEQFKGPSLALTSKKFHARFGTDDELLERTNKLLEKHDVSRL